MNEGIVKMKVIGAGGAGGNAINDIIESGITGVEFIAVNTDAQDLNRSLADVRIQIGEKLTKGLGAGANPEKGKLAAQEDEEKLKILLEDTDLLFITAGMGGGTGTGASPVIAGIAREMGILTIAIVTRPFTFEGKKRKINSDYGIEELRGMVDALVIVPNDKLFELPDKTITIVNAFKEANNILKIGIRGIAELMIGNGLINLDFADIKAAIQNSGIAVLGFGEGEGENRAIKAAEKALQSPLLERSINGASKVLINITGSSSVGLQEASIISDNIRDAAGKSPEEVIFGISLDESFGGKIQVTVIGTNFLDGEEKSEPFINIAKPEKTLEETIEKEKEPKEDLDLPPWLRNKG